MVKLYMTGDNHFGKKYDRYPSVKEKLIQSRFDVLDDMVKKAEEEGCALFVVTGDLFDSVHNIKISDVKKVAEILSKFAGSVLVLPGNHDYFTGAEKVWKDFEKVISEMNHNITLIKEYRPYEFEAGDEMIVVYPAYCDSKHSKENKLGWIKESVIDRDSAIRIGVAHGALKGITPDLKEEYFLMSEQELNAIPMDAWLIGHTHIPYPNVLETDQYISGFKIFNAGTHEQTDLSNNTEGNGFILSIEKEGRESQVYAKKHICGRIHFYDRTIEIASASDSALREAVEKEIREIDTNSIIRLTLKGTVRQEEYRARSKIFEEMLSDFLAYEIADTDLCEEITIEKIRSEFAETSFAYQLLEEFISDPTELQMIYNLMMECRDE